MILENIIIFDITLKLFIDRINKSNSLYLNFIIIALSYIILGQSKNCL